MKKATVIYASLISAAGLAAGTMACVWFFMSGGYNPIGETLFLCALLALCRCLPLALNDECSLDMSFIALVTVVLVRGPIAGAALYMLTTPFTIETGENGKIIHIFNRMPIKTAFNTANLVLTILISGIFFELLHGSEYGTELPQCLLPLVVYVAVSMIVNSLIMSALCKFEMGMGIGKMLVNSFAQFLPSILCSAPIGYFIAMLMNGHNGIYIAILFILPLLLARYELKLYLDSKRQAYNIIETLTAAIEAKDQYTVGHSKRVADISELLAREMKFPDKRIGTIKIAALLHDIGKIGIDDAVLKKPGSLTDEEFSMIRRHPEKSVQIIKHIDYYGDIQTIIRSHHERYDGKGYPDGLAGDAVPIESCIISVADAFDAMTTDRPYRKGFELARAADIIIEESGKQFNPKVVAAFLSLYSEGAIH